LGGKNELRTSVYEPFQCCPTKVKKSTKFPKVTSASANTNVKLPSGSGGSERKKYTAEQIVKSSNKAKESKKEVKDVKRAKGSPDNEKDKGNKGKKGFFDNGKYIWFW
jgi:hypothetical protein